jgi:hypothetical protein
MHEPICGHIMWAAGIWRGIEESRLLAFHGLYLFD